MMPPGQARCPSNAESFPSAGGADADPAVAAAAYAGGFSAGAAAAAAAFHAAMRSQEPPAAAQRPYRQASSAIGPAVQPQPCKWFAKGTCRFGAECRFSHQGQQPVAFVASRPQPTADAMPRQAQRGADRAAGSARNQESVARLVGQVKVAAHLCPAPSSSSTASSEHAEEDAPVIASAGCQVVWCDQRAFKDEFSSLRAELEKEVGVPVKMHRTADKCMRLLQKKKPWREMSAARPPCVFLVSWANAPALVPYLSRAPHERTRVIVLCDLCKSRGRDAAERWTQQYPVVEKVAASWTEAIEEVAKVVASCELWV